MVAIVDAPSRTRLERIHGVVFEHHHARVVQPLEILGRHAERSYGVVDQIDGDTLRSFGEQEIREPVARLALLDHVELDVHVIACAFDRAEHRLVSRGTVLEQSRRVTGRQRSAGDRLFDEDVPLEHVAPPPFSFRRVTIACDVSFGSVPRAPATLGDLVPVLGSNQG